jgi:hypothetical protein
MAFAVITILLLGLTLLLLLSLGFLPREAATSFQRSKELARSLTNDFALSIYFGWIKLRMTYDSLVGRKKLRAHQLREWAKKELAHKDELHSWLSQLPDSGFEAVSEGVSRHCRDFNISLEWLFSREMNVAPEISGTVKSLVSEYLNSCFIAVNHKEAISLFSVYQDLVDSSRLKQTIELRRSVFKKVISLGLVDPVPAYDLIMSSELERQHIAAAALRNAATKDWNQFAQALSIVLLQNQQSEP